MVILVFLLLEPSLWLGLTGVLFALPLELSLSSCRTFYQGSRVFPIALFLTSPMLLHPPIFVTLYLFFPRYGRFYKLNSSPLTMTRSSLSLSLSSNSSQTYIYPSTLVHLIPHPSPHLPLSHLSTAFLFPLLCFCCSLCCYICLGSQNPCTPRIRFPPSFLS